MSSPNDTLSNAIRPAKPVREPQKYVFSAAIDPESQQFDVVCLREVRCSRSSRNCWVETPTNCEGEFILCLNDRVAFFLMNIGSSTSFEIQIDSATVSFTNASGDRNPYRVGGKWTNFVLVPTTGDALTSPWTRGLQPKQAWYLNGLFNEEQLNLEPPLQQNGTYHKTLELRISYRNQILPPMIHDPRWIVGTGHPRRPVPS